MAFYEQKHGFDADYFMVGDDEDFSFPAHVHRCLEVVSVDEGELFITVNDREWRLSEGDCILIWSNQIHEFRTETHSRHHLCVFAPELVTRFFASHAEQIPLCPVVRGPRAAIVGQAIRSLAPEDDVLRAKGLLYILTGELEKGVTFRRRERGRHAEGSVLLTQLLSYMNENYMGDCSMSAMAEELCYEKTYLSKFFTKNVGISPAEYVMQLRLAKACERLLASEDSVISVGNASGFNSLRTFNRNFLAHYGMTPSQYRAVHAEKSSRA